MLFDRSREIERLSKKWLQQYSLAPVEGWLPQRRDLATRPNRCAQLTFGQVTLQQARTYLAIWRLYPPWPGFLLVLWSRFALCCTLAQSTPHDVFAGEIYCVRNFWVGNTFVSALDPCCLTLFCLSAPRTPLAARGEMLQRTALPSSTNGISLQVRGKEVDVHVLGSCSANKQRHHSSGTPPGHAGALAVTMAPTFAWI